MSGRRIAVFTLAGMLAAFPALGGCIGESTALMEEYKEQGIALMEDGDYEGAVEKFQTALDQSVGTIEAEEIDLSYYKALALYMSGDSDGAVEVYTSLIDFDGKDWEPYYLRGTIYLEEGMGDEALIDYAAADALNADNAELCLHICANLADAGMEEEAMPYLNLALAANPSEGDDYYDLGRIYYLTGEYEEAETYLLQAREMGEDGSILLLAELYTDIGDEERASAMYSEYLDQHPDDPQVLAWLGENALEEGDYELAISYLRMARQDAKGDSLTAIVTNLIAAYEYSGDFESAWEVAAAYLAENSDDDIEREYTFLSTRIGAVSVSLEEAEAAEGSMDEGDYWIEGYGNESDDEEDYYIYFDENE